MNSVLVSTAILVLVGHSARAQWREPPRFASAVVAPTAPMQTAVPPTVSAWREAPLAASGHLHQALSVDATEIRSTHWLLGGLVGSTVFGLLGAATGVGLGECRCVKDALLGFVPGALVGFPIGALVGAQFANPSQ